MLARTMVDETSPIGWFVALCAFASCFAWMGVVKAVAVLLPTLQDQFGTPTWLAGWMVAIIDGVIEITGPLAPPVTEMVGLRVVVMVSGVLIGGSLVVAAFLSSFTLITLVLAGFAAPAIGACTIASRGLIGRWFPKSHARAFAFTALGGSLAFVIIAPLTQFLLQVYGWRGTVVLLGGIMFHITACGALVSKEPVHQGTVHNEVKYRALINGVSNHEEMSKGIACDCKCFPLPYFSECLNLNFFRLPRYWLIVVIAICTTTAATSWVVYFVPHTSHSKGFPLSDISMFVAVFGVGKIAGCVVAGLPDYCRACPTKALLAMAVVGSSSCFLVDLSLTSYYSIMSYAFLYGCCHSVVYTLLDAVTKEEVGGELLASALGWISLKTGIVRSLVLFFPGLIYDNFGNYALAFMLMSGINAMALPALLVLKWLEFRTKNVGE